VAAGIELDDGVKTGKGLFCLVERDAVDHHPGVTAKPIAAGVAGGNADHEARLEAAQRQIAIGHEAALEAWASRRHPREPRHPAGQHHH
jgi:hypothetical protein